MLACRVAVVALFTVATACADWPADLGDRVSADDIALLKRAKSILVGNVVASPAWAPNRGIQPSRGKYAGVWNWDAAFHAMAASTWDPMLAREQVRIVFGRQLDNGMLPDVIYATGKVNVAASKPPVMSWAVAVVDHRAPDDAFLREMYPKLVKLGAFWLAERGGAKDGLFFYAGSDTGWDSGWDTSIRWDDGYRASKTDDQRLWAIDLNCYMVMHYRALAYVAGRLGLADDQKKWAGEADALSARINERLWDESRGSYVDRDRASGAFRAALTPAAFMPLFAHVAEAGRAERMARLAADPARFFPGMPTAAYDSAGYKSGDYWRGPAWLNTSYFALKGLRDYGCGRLAESMRGTLLGWVRGDPEQIWEYYDSRTGKGGGAKFFGWSCAFTIALVTDWADDDLTWLLAPPQPVANEVLPPAS